MGWFKRKCVLKDLCIDLSAWQMTKPVVPYVLEAVKLLKIKKAPVPVSAVGFMVLI